MEDLEVEYTPSLFSKRFPNRDELLTHFIKFSKDESDKMRKTLDCHLNISYGQSNRQKLDIYGDDLPASAPLFVFLHGGYWQELDKDISAFCGVPPLVKQGIRVIIADYDLCPDKTLEEIVEQIKACFKWISEYVNKNMIKSLSIAGHSAGGHLMACGLTNNFVNSIRDVKISNYFISGVYYLDELRHLNAANENNILSLNDDNWKKLSPLFYDFSHLKRANIKNFVLVGAHESKKFQEHSTKFANESLKGTDVQLKILENLDHFDIVEKLAESDYDMTRLILQNF